MEDSKNTFGSMINLVNAQTPEKEVFPTQQWREWIRNEPEVDDLKVYAQQGSNMSSEQLKEIKSLIHARLQNYAPSQSASVILIHSNPNLPRQLRFMFTNEVGEFFVLWPKQPSTPESPHQIKTMNSRSKN